MSSRGASGAILIREILSFAAVITLVGSVSASAELAHYSNENKSVFVLPRDAALAGADIAFSRNALSHGNPASLPLDSGSQVVVSYAGYYANTFSTSSASYVTHFLGNSGLGVSVGYLYVPDIEITTGLELDGSGEPIHDPAHLRYTSFSEVLLNVAYGRKLLEKKRMALAAGGRLHGLRRRLPDDIGYGLGIDAGLVMALARPGLRLSLQLDDITTNYIYWGSSYEDVSLPAVRMGVTWQKEIQYLYGRFSAAYKTPDVLSFERVWLTWDSNERELQVVEEGNLKDNALSFLFQGHYGAEYVIRDIVALRGGFTSGRFSFGGGLCLFSSALALDFSYATSELDGTYLVSVGYRW